MKDIQADTVVAEFQTDENKLSVWKIENEEDLTDAFIALGSNCENICTITAVKIEDKDLKTISFEDEEGVTPTFGINHKHKNMIKLNYCSLGRVILSVIRGLKSNCFVKRTRGEMKKILVQAYNEHILDTDNLNENLLREVMKALENGG